METPVAVDPVLADICGRLYDIVDDNLRANGHVMRFSRELTVSQIRKGDFDPCDFDHLSCHDFLVVCYMRLLGRLPESRLRFYPTADDEVPPGCDAPWCHVVLPEFFKSLEFLKYHEIEHPPPPLPPPPPPPSFLNERLYFKVRAILKHITPFFLRDALNSLLRHDEH